MRILSFDCANRSLAVCYLSIDDNYATNLRSALKTNTITEYAKVIENYIRIHIIRIYDVTKKEKCPTVERTILLKKCLNEIDDVVKKCGVGAPDQVLIEYQMSLNDKSRCVSQQILYHYSLKNTMALVGPTLKNKIYFSKNLMHGVFMEKYASKYTANKNHAKENLKYWLKVHGQLQFLENVPKKNYDDLADSFMQILGWWQYGR
jgi:hypothetical protein